MSPVQLPTQSRQCAWPEIFGDLAAVAAMVERLVPHAEIIVLKRGNFRFRGRRQQTLNGEKGR